MNYDSRKCKDFYETKLKEQFKNTESQKTNSPIPNSQFPNYPYSFLFGRSLRAGLSAISLLASFPPRSQIPVPLAKDAASIPNALGEL